MLSLLVLSLLTQQPSVRVNPTEIRRLDLSGKEAQREFLTELDTIAEGYEKAGAIDRAKETLRFRQKIAESEDVAAKLDELDELRFENETEIKLEATGKWFNTGLDLKAGDEVRIGASGRYRVMYNQELGPDGVPANDVLEAYLPDVPLGTLVGAVFPPPDTRSGTNRRRTSTRGAKPAAKPKRPEPSDPQLIGTEAVFNPPIDGRLFLKLNIPSDTRATGSITVTVSGPFETGR